MTTKELLKQVIVSGNTENKGICVSSLFETRDEFIDRWFSKSETRFTGLYLNNTEYLYSYNEELKGVADGIIKTNDSIIYLYRID